MRKFLPIALTVVVLLSGVAWGEGFGPDHLITIDLGRRADFDRAAAIGLKPVFRSGNQFYAVVDGVTLTALTTAHLPFRIVETSPSFKDQYYYVQSTTAARKYGAPIKSAGDVIDEMSGWRLWKSDVPLSPEANPYGASICPLTGREVAFTYLEPLTAFSAVPATPINDSIVGMIAEDSIISYASYLENLGTRYTFTETNDIAQAYLQAKFASFGYTDVDIDTFPVEGWYGHNVICTKPGTAEPDKCIIIGAHYDSYNGDTDPMIYAPGCDDNASGTVGVLEIARALFDIPTRKTIIFIAFDGEEQWMYGSYYYANRFAAAGGDADVMINMDMIGYEPGGAWEVWLNTNFESMGYATAAEQFANQYTGLSPLINPYIGASDQLPFEEAGYHVLWAEEGEFNDPNYHHSTDRLSELNTPYWTDVVRMIGLVTYNAAESPQAVTGVELWDVGDGHSLEARWTPLTTPDITGYRVYYGIYPGAQTNVINVSGASSAVQQIGGLTEGNEYYVSVAAVLSNGKESMVRPEASLTPYHIPRTPENVTADPQYQHVELHWASAVELDLDHYEIYRGLDTASLALFDAGATASPYLDYAVAAATRYFYRIRAIDNTANPSGMSDIVNAVPATFDQGILLVDQTAQQGSLLPSQEEQEAVYNSMFGAYAYRYFPYDDFYTPIDKSDVGQYGTIFWIDDDPIWESWPAEHLATLNWYLSFANNLVFIGWYTPNEVESSGLLYEAFRVSDVQRINDADCIGGTGESGFPDVIFDTAKVTEMYAPWGGKLPYIWTMTTADPSAEVIYRYNSATDNPVRETQPVAVRRIYNASKMALIGLPLYWMRLTDAQAMIATLAAWFDLSSADPGDLNADGSIDIADVMMSCHVVFEGMFPTAGLDYADTNGDCACNVLDVVYMIDYVFRGGPDPFAGCVK